MRIQLMRLKDKLGNRSNASAEIEYHGAYAMLLGEPGRGIATIIAMVHHTRLDTHGEHARHHARGPWPRPRTMRATALPSAGR